jgi:hypothetical protein
MVLERQLKAVDAHETLRHDDCLAAEQRIETIRREARVEGMREVISRVGGMNYGYGNGYNEGHDAALVAVTDAINAMIAKEEGKA